MGKKRHLNGKVLLSLLLGIGAALFFLWPFPSHNAEDGPVAGITAPAIPALPGEEAGQNPEPGQSQQADQPRTPGQNAAEAQTQNQTETPAPYDENAGKIRFSELTIKNRATLPDEDGDFPDWIELENVSGDTWSSAAGPCGIPRARTAGASRRPAWARGSAWCSSPPGRTNRAM